MRLRGLCAAHAQARTLPDITTNVQKELHFQKLDIVLCRTRTGTPPREMKKGKGKEVPPRRVWPCVWHVPTAQLTR